jgi:hypothetical protein
MCLKDSVQLGEGSNQVGPFCRRFESFEAAVNLGHVAATKMLSSDNSSIRHALKNFENFLIFKKILLIYIKLLFHFKL